MEFFDTFPFTKLQGKNRGLDWVMQKISEFQKEIEKIPEYIKQYAPDGGHAERRDNPHKVTAAQVGARPNTWMPTAQEVGAAPAGYGLGDFSGTPCSDCNAAVQVGFYRMVGSGAINTPSEIYAFKWGSLIVDATISTVFQTIKSAYATAHRAGTKSGSTVTWGEWEYSISPMDVGVEYRTTERWNGKPVYTMMANIGALPNNTGKTTEDGPLPMGITPISAYGIGLNGKTGAVIPSRHIYLSVYGEWGTVYVNTDSDYSDYTGYIIVKYVRE